MSKKIPEDWMNTKWRPMMGWMYMAVCTMDFIVFPILWSLLQSISDGKVESQWSPITLQGAELFHMAMGAILGIAAFGRTQEKLAGVNNDKDQYQYQYYVPEPRYSDYPESIHRVVTNTRGKKIVPIYDEPEL